MATRLKTVEYCFPVLASLVNNTLTNLTQITIYLPEATKTFKNITLRLSMDDIITATGGSITTKTVNLRLGAASYTSIANANTLTNSGENLSLFWIQDFTSHFVSNWTGTSMTCDVQVQINQSTGTTLGMVNVCATLEITYEYDDTATTQIKTVYLPLNAPVGALATSKPGTANATIRALDTYLPEASKTYRRIYIVAQGNMCVAGATTDSTLALQIDTYTQFTSGNHEGALASDRWFRYVADCTSLGIDTSVTHGFYIWGSVARYNHLQAYMVVTYEFNASTTTSVMNSLILPLEMMSPMGGTASTDAQLGEREVFIEEPGTITVCDSAALLFWNQVGTLGGLNVRVNSASYVTYTDTAAALCGSNGLMFRAESAISLARGRNTVKINVYRTDTTDLGFNVGALIFLNYTSGKHTDGVGAHNHTIKWCLASHSTVAAAVLRDVASTGIAIPETNYYITAIGTLNEVMLNNTGTFAGYTALFERLSAEGGPQWIAAYCDISMNDPEVGLLVMVSQIKANFKRFPGDQDADRLALETNRRWRLVCGNSETVFHCLSIYFTYHTITFSVAGTVSGSAGGTVTLDLHRSTSGERVLQTTRAGNGAFSFTWYDDTENVYVSAREDATHVGRSEIGVGA